MNKKTKNILLISILAIFIISIIVILIVKSVTITSSDETERLDDKNWAVNSVVSNSEESSRVTTKEFYNKYMTNVTFEDLDNLNYEQEADRNTMFNLITNTAFNEEIDHGSLTSIKILDTSNKQLVYVKGTFTDNYEEEYVLIYDEVNTHSFLNCQTVKKYNLYRNTDINKG